MKLAEIIKNSILNRNKSGVETIVLNGKQCPHCVSRGTYIFKNENIKENSDGSKNGNNKKTDH